jgi:hypothetical protein
MFVGLRILVGSSIHSVASSMFVLSAEVMPEPKRVANGAVFNSSEDSTYPAEFFMQNLLFTYLSC